MHVEPYADHEVVALLGQSVLASGRVPTLVAVNGDEPVGAVRVVERPDGRSFVQLHGSLEARAALVDAIDDPRPCLVVAESDTSGRETAARLGFRVEVVMESFVLPFAAVGAFMARSWSSARMSIVRVLDVPIEVVAALDTDLRGAVPGVDGWVTTPEFIQSELNDDDFDPGAYLVGLIDDEPAGLVRIWRTERGPKFGLIGVLPRFRRTTLAAALSAQALRAASTWGHGDIRTSASTANPVTHPLLLRLGAVSEGRSLQMRRG